MYTENRRSILRPRHRDAEVDAVGTYVKMFDSCGQEDSLQSLRGIQDRLRVFTVDKSASHVQIFLVNVEGVHPYTEGVG